MIDFERATLSNGLEVIVHTDMKSQMCAVNVLYKVGARDEDPEKTGFAHLFEHLMFGGSDHAPDFDGPLQMAGGDNNAFTNSDITNFYDILPADNLETALWLEADRMAHLTISSDHLEIQRKVVLEEFSETCLNPPFGKVWHHICEMAYEKHPYRWPVIGRTPEHIERASLDDVRDFFTKWYGPNNAIITISGGVPADKAIAMVEKYFGGIEKRTFERKLYPQDGHQLHKKTHHDHGQAPIDSLYMAWRGSDRLSEDYYTMDLLSDVLSGGRSARFFERLVLDKQLFASIDAYISGTADPGLFIVEGKPNEGVSLEMAEAAINAELQQIIQEGIHSSELELQINKAESQMKFSEVNNLHKAMSLAYHEALGDAAMLRTEMDRYRAVTPEKIQSLAQNMLTEERCCALYYHKS